MIDQFDSLDSLDSPEKQTLSYPSPSLMTEKKEER